jgi:Domain of unknown function (DUF1850)
VRNPLAGLALAGVLLAAGCGGREVVVRDVLRGRVLVREALPADGRFALEYRHSYYGVPARERFEAAGDGFRMTGVESPSEAVLDYYAIAGAKTPGRWMALAPAEPRRFDRLPLIATATGRRTLEVAGRRYPLYARAPRHLIIEVEDARWP